MSYQTFGSSAYNYRKSSNEIPAIRIESEPAGGIPIRASACHSRQPRRGKLCVAGLEEAAVRAGVTGSVASRALDIAQPDEKVLRLSEVQPEFKTPIWDYLGFLVDEQRVADGRAMMCQYDQILRAAERRFGVDRHVITAVWGVETDYGREAGGCLAVDFDGDGQRDLVPRSLTARLDGELSEALRLAGGRSLDDRGHGTAPL